MNKKIIKSLLITTTIITGTLIGIIYITKEPDDTIIDTIKKTYSHNRGVIRL